MTPSEIARAYAALYGPSIESMRAALPDLADGLHAQLNDFFMRPTPEEALSIAVNLSGAQRLVMRMHERLSAECEVTHGDA